MGIFDKIFGKRSSSKSEKSAEPSPDIVIEDSLSSEFISGNFRGSRVMFQSVESPNGEWHCLYASSGLDDGAPIVLVNSSSQVAHAFSVTRVEDAAVANNGTIVVTDIGDATDQDLRGTLVVVDSNGEPIVEHEFDANIWRCAITDNGRYASTATHNPDRTVYIFDTDTGEVVTEYETPNLNGPSQKFGSHEGEEVLYLLDGDSRYRAINLDGETVWRSEELVRKDRYEELRASGEEADLEEALELLDEAYELANGEYEKKPVARELAETHWKLAKEIWKEEGDTDEWWANLNQAKMYYMEILPWHDGKKGVAKVQRKQAKYHLKKGNENMALELLQNIATMEDEYDVQLLTDHDKKTIKELS